MMPLPRVLASVSVYALLVCAGLSAAQNAPDAVSKELMTVLLRGPGMALGDKFDLQIGMAPQTFPIDLLPPGSEIGAAGVSDRGMVVVGVAPDFNEAGRWKEMTRLEALGWGAMTLMPRGFLPTSASATQTVCRGGDLAILAVVPRSARGSFVRVSLTREPGRSCPVRPPMPSGMADVGIPAMFAPEGTKLRPSGGGGSNDASYVSGRLESPLAMRDIARHYIPQL